MWKRGILSWMREKSLTEYTADTGEEFIHSFIKPGYVTARERDVIRSVKVLTDFMNLGCIRRKTFIPVKYPLEGEIGRQMQRFISYLQSQRRSSITIRDYELYLNRFLTFLQGEGVYTVSGIRECDILKFVSTRENNKVNIVSILRVLFRFWHEEHVIEKKFDELLAHYKWIKSEKIPSYYTASEVSVMEKSVERSSGVGKRGYAMLLLASRLGLRASDIAHLKFSNIDWDNYEIHLTQYKTGKSIILPLLSDVGNAIIDYLQHGRFQSDSGHVFLSARAPYIPANKTIVCQAIARIIEQSGVSIEKRHHGPHSLRHSLASRLLENSVSINVISETLGHTSTETTMSYLRIDISSLLKCSLPVPPVCDDFYMQLGGAFYE
jgi:site-specific recombinase XerD